MSQATLVAASTKGGVRKSTTLDDAAVFLAQEKGEPTIILDTDSSNCGISQKNLRMETDPTAAEGWMPPIHPSYDPNNPAHFNWDGRSSTASIFLDTPVLPYPTRIKNLDILPAYSSQLGKVEDISPSLVESHIYKKLEEWMKNSEILKKYRWILIDTPPVRFKTTKAAINVATHLIIPTIYEPIPVEGVFGMLQLWQQQNLKRSKDNPLKLIGILGSMYRKGVTIQEELKDFLRNNAGASPYLIPHDIALSAVFSECDHSRMYGEGKTIFDYPKSNKSRKQVVEVCEYIYERLKK